ncbi:MAG: exodeoxyribonuclease VII large subunit [Flavobacteriales bacterium]|nr:exodeoxyribonuclease VII large subunit [Flavobacteriales bacterium]
MPDSIKLSELVNEIDKAIKNRFAGQTFWIKAEITDVKKQPDKRWCFLKFIEKDGNLITTEIKGVFWANTYHNIERFEKETQQTFASGLEITCNVRVRFHKRYGIDLEVLAIDYAYAIGKLELERKRTLERLVKENPTIKLLPNGTFSTKNNRTELTMVFQTIALITAPNSDGQRDFNKVIDKNKYGYAFSVTPFLTTIQGDNASQLILKQLKLIEASKEKFDVVVIVRGGGSDIDFKSFNDYELAKAVAMFPTPILTGIGHDRNTNIVDLMSRQHKTPTEVATYIIDNNMNFEAEIDELKERFFQRVDELLDDAKDELASMKQRIKNLHPTTILKKGFAIIKSNNKILTDTKRIKVNSELQTIMQSETITSTVTRKIKNEKGIDL